MKKPFIMLMMSSCLLSTPSIAQVVVNDPVATSQAVITCGNARFTVLTPEMIRVEYSEQAKFEDRATFTIVNRKLDAPQFTKSEDDTYFIYNDIQPEAQVSQGYIFSLTMRRASVLRLRCLLQVALWSVA